MLFKSNSSETGVGTCLIFSHHPTKKGIHFLQQIVVQVVWIKNCKFLDLFSKFKSSHLVRWFPTNKFIYREFPIFSQVFPMISREILRPPPSSRGFHPASAARRGRRSWKPAVVTTAVVTGNSENHGENHIIYKFQCLLPHVVRYFAIIYIYIYIPPTLLFIHHQCWGSAKWSWRLRPAHQGGTWAPAQGNAATEGIS